MPLATSRSTVWIASEVHDPEPSTGFYIARLAEDLAATYNVRVVTRRSGIRSDDNVASGSDLKLERIGPRARARLPFALRFFDGIVFLLAVSMHLLRQMRAGDTLIVVTNPPVLPYGLAPIAKARGVRMIVLVHDVYPELLAVTGHLAGNGMIMRALRRAAARVDRSAAVTVVLGRDMKVKVEERRPDKLIATAIIPNWADVDRIYPDATARSSIRSRWGINDHFVALFIGNMGRLHDVDLLLNLAAKFRSDARIRFVLAARGAQAESLASAIKARQLTNMILVPPCSNEELRGYLSAGDVVLLPMRPGAEGLCVPSRIYSIMAAARPMIAAVDELSECGLLLLETSAGRVVRPGDGDQFAAALMTLLENTSERVRMGAAARRAVETRFTRAHSRRAWQELVSRIAPV